MLRMLMMLSTHSTDGKRLNRFAGAVTCWGDPLGNLTGVIAGPDQRVTVGRSKSGSVNYCQDLVQNQIGSATQSNHSCGKNSNDDLK
jgi:hypothetical protein